ncbi:MAG: ribonuclease III [Rhodothermales bacterium]
MRFSLLSLFKSRIPASPVEAAVPDDAHALVDRAAIEALVGAPIGPIRLYEQALKHRSLLRTDPSESHLASNERLEFLGDAVLGFVTAEHLYALYPGENEGFLTRMRAKLVNGKALSRWAERLELGSLVLISDNMEQSGGRANRTILADAMEAFIGAIYLDLGMDATRRFIYQTLLDTLDLDALATTRENFKSLLLEYAQAQAWSQPRYEVVGEEGPSHDKRFTIVVWVNGEAYGPSTGSSKKRAEQQAAAIALEQLHAEAEPIS